MGGETGRQGEGVNLGGPLRHPLPTLTFVWGHVGRVFAEEQ